MAAAHAVANMPRMINVGGEAGDAYYRYKMPAIETKNGVVTNLAEVAKSLRVDPLVLLKFFSVELGVATSFGGGRARVRGRPTAAALQALVGRFVESFVLCRRCHLPETSFVAGGRGGGVVARCFACGHSAPLPHRHRVTKFIARRREPSAAPGVFAPAAGSSGGSGSDDDGGSDDDNASVWVTDTSEEAARARAEEEYKDAGCGSSSSQPAGIRSAIFDAVAKNEPEAVPAALRAVAPALARAAGASGGDGPAVIGWLEEALGSRLAPLMPHLLKVLYDDDVLEEDTIIEWYYSPSPPIGAEKRLRAAARELVAWLETAEEEDDEDEAGQ